MIGFWVGPDQRNLSALANILGALGAKIERVIVNDLKRGIYFARLVLSSENELQ
jgi:bifunctional DNase/RNase